MWRLNHTWSLIDWKLVAYFCKKAFVNIIALIFFRHIVHMFTFCGFCLTLWYQFKKKINKKYAYN